MDKLYIYCEARQEAKSFAVRGNDGHWLYETSALDWFFDFRPFTYVGLHSCEAEPKMLFVLPPEAQIVG